MMNPNLMRCNASYEQKIPTPSILMLQSAQPVGKWPPAMVVIPCTLTRDIGDLIQSLMDFIRALELSLVLVMKISQINLVPALRDM